MSGLLSIPLQHITASATTKPPSSKETYNEKVKGTSPVIGPVKLDTQLEILSVVIPEVECEIDFLYNLAFSEPLFLLSPYFETVTSSIEIGITLTLIVSGLPVFVLTNSVNLPRTSLTFPKEKQILGTYKSTVPFIADIVNPPLLLQGQSMTIDAVLAVSTGIIPTAFRFSTVTFNELEKQDRTHETEIESELAEGVMKLNIPATGNIITREISTLPNREDDTAPPRRVI